jgi:hypothetical protein
MRYPIEKARPKFGGIWRANVSSFAWSLMSVHRTNQTHGPILRQNRVTGSSTRHGRGSLRLQLYAEFLGKFRINFN